MNKTRLLKRSRFFYNRDSNGDIGDEMKWFTRISTFLCAALLLTGCSGPSMNTVISATEAGEAEMTAYDRDTPIQEVLSDPSFGEYARLLFPIEEGYYSGDTLGTLRLVWYNNIDPDKTVEIVNSLKVRVNAGQTIFYDIYT